MCLGALCLHRGLRDEDIRGPSITRVGNLGVKSKHYCRGAMLGSCDGQLGQYQAMSGQIV